MDLVKYAHEEKKSVNRLTGVVYSPPMDAKTRIRQRIKRLLEDRGKTQHELAQWLGHGDQWASNLLSGKHALSWDDLDRTADFLRVPPGELVRAYDEPWELAPHEMRVIRALRMMPPTVREHYVTTADYLIGVLPDEIDFVLAIRSLEDDAEAKEAILHWIDLKRLERAHARRGPRRADRPETTAPPPASTRPVRKTRRE